MDSKNLSVKLDKLKKSYKRKIERNRVKINDYENRFETLSVNGYWSLGYLKGENSKMEDFLDDLEDLELEIKKEVSE